jgi:hypothetical protein
MSGRRWTVGVTSLPECWDTRRAGTPAVLGRMRGTSTFSTSLSSHTLIIAVSLYQRYTRAVYELIPTFLTKHYVSIAALSANVTNSLHCVYSSVALL